jgi:hypothetical protein
MDTQPPLPGESGSHTGILAGATSEFLGTQQESRYNLVHRDAANAATKHMTQDAHFKIVRRTGSSKNKKQHALGCKYIDIEANGGQLTVKRTVGVRRELGNEFIDARNGKSPWSTKAFICTVHESTHHDVLCSGMFTDEIPDKHPREWTKQAVITLQDATEAYMVEVTAEFNC